MMMVGAYYYEKESPELAFLAGITLAATEIFSRMVYKLDRYITIACDVYHISTDKTIQECLQEKIKERMINNIGEFAYPPNRPLDKIIEKIIGKSIFEIMPIEDTFENMLKNNFYSKMSDFDSNLCEYDDKEKIISTEIENYFETLNLWFSESLGNKYGNLKNAQIYSLTCNTDVLERFYVGIIFESYVIVYGEYCILFFIGSSE